MLSAPISGFAEVHMNTCPYERISKNIHLFKDAIKSEPDVIFITMKFHQELLKNMSLSLRYMPMQETLFGMKYYLVREHELDGLDFQCFKSSHLNDLVDRYNRDSRWQTYELEIYVPTLSIHDISNISNGSPAPTIADRDPLRRTKIVVPNAVLKTWVCSEYPELRRLRR